MLTELIEQFGYEEVLSLAKKTDGLLVKHVEWLKNIQKIIICNLPLTGLSYHSKEEYRNCEFGKWYYSTATRPFIKNEEFIELGKNHKRLHDRAYDLLMKYKSNNKINEEEYDLFSGAEKDFIENLQKFINKVDATKFQFDALTNLPNKKVMEGILEKEYYRVSRGKEKCCIAIADIDHFKNVNDTYGHLVGDKVLKEIANCFVASLRRYDVVSRYGGEEFLFCMPETRIDEAKEIIERLRHSLANLQIDIGDSSMINVTCSFGIAEMKENLPIIETINNADKAMYRAKKEGRNTTRTWDK